MGRDETVGLLVAARVIAVIRANNEKIALNIAETLLAGGLQAIEVTFTVPGAERVIEAIRARHPEALIGAGTVRDEKLARRAIAAGAQYVVSPGLNPGVIQSVHKYDLPVFSGVLTPTEAMQALDAGADVLKLFPASLLGPDYLQALRGPLPDALWCPTGGVSVANCEKWIQAGAALVGVGGASIT